MKFSNAKRGGELIFQVWSGKKKGGEPKFSSNPRGEPKPYRL